MKGRNNNHPRIQKISINSSKMKSPERIMINQPFTFEKKDLSKYTGAHNRSKDSSIYKFPNETKAKKNSHCEYIFNPDFDGMEGSNCYINV
jgi:hypothetical protein